MHFIVDFFALIGFWWSMGLFSIGVILIGGLAENDRDWTAFWVSMALTGCGWLIYRNADWSFDAIEIVEFVAVYVIVGFVWALIKWFSYVRSQLHIFKELKEKWDSGDKRNDLQTMLVLMHYDWKNEPDYMPNARKRKSKIASWWGYWPASFAWTVLSKWILELWNTLADLSIGLFHKISQAVFSGVMKG